MSIDISISDSDNIIDGHICLKKSHLKYIDDNKVGYGYKNRSEYIQSLVEHDLHFNRFDFLVEWMSMLMMPMMAFLFFFLISILTHGLLFYFFTALFGIVTVFFSIVYYLRHRIQKNRGSS